MIKPLPGYCLIQPIEDEEKSAGGVYLPETSKDKPMKGKVVAVGSYWLSEEDVVKTETWESKQLYLLHKSIREGSTVIYKKWTNQEVQHEGKTYLLVSFAELLAIVE